MRIAHIAFAATCCLCGAVHAQTTAVPSEEPTGESTIAEIVVTAQKRAQSLEDVALAVSALGADELTQSQITTVADLGARIPNISVGTQQGQANIFIRGIGLDNNFAGADPSVALHVDGAVVSQSSAQLGSFLDLERIEVLRGPQGTLYGRNATGGVVNLITAKPTPVVSGYARTTFGNYDLLVAEGAVSGPIAGDKVAARVAFRTEDRSGFGHNELTGQQIDDAKKRSARAHLQFRPSDELELLLSGEWHREDDGAYSYKFREVAYPGASEPALQPVAATGFAAGVRDVRSEGVIRNDRETSAITATATWSMNDAFTLRSISNYRDNEVNPIQDLDVSSLATPSRQNNYVRGHQLSEELQLLYEGSRFDGLIAAFYFKEDLFGENSVGLNPGRELDPAIRNIRLAFQGEVDIESYALFGQGTYQLTDQVALTVGGRLTYEDRQGDSLFRVPPANINIPYRTGADFDDFSPRATLEWRPLDDLLLFATYSEGFKSGIILIGQLNPILRPETVKNYEVGLKSTLFGRTLTFNLTAFTEDFTDLQIGKTLPGTGPTSIQTVFENAASAKIDGAELEINWLTPLRGLSLSGAAGYLDARFDEYVSADALSLPNAIVQDLRGKRLPQSSEWTASARIEYAIDLAGGGSITLKADTDYRSEMFFSAFNLDRISQPSRSLYNANIQYSSPDERFTLNLWGKNLSDELVYTGLAGINTSRLILATYMPPRTYGITAGYRF